MNSPVYERISGAVRSPVTFSVPAGVVIGALFPLGTGADPVTAYGAVLTGALGADGLGSTLSTGTSVLGMAPAPAIPLRAVLINLGGDGQLVLGGITAAVTGLYVPAPATRPSARTTWAFRCWSAVCCSATRRCRWPPIWPATRFWPATR